MSKDGPYYVVIEYDKFGRPTERHYPRPLPTPGLWMGTALLVTYGLMVLSIVLFVLFGLGPLLGK